MSELIIGANDTDTFTVTLPKYNLRWTLTRSTYLELYPESLLARALELDSKATNIDITESCVTPTVMSILYLITDKYGLISKYIPQIESLTPNMILPLVQASRYLLVDELGLFSHAGILIMLTNTPYAQLVSLIDKTIISKPFRT